MSTTPVLARTNPYRGLIPFGQQDASRFFGRDTEIDDILQRLASQRLLAVIGVSGSGKSSLVQAGVVPVIRIGAAEHLPGPWRICTLNPGNAPVAALRNALQAPTNWPATSFDLIEHARNTLQPGEKLLLIIDQFEELFRFRAETLDKDAGNEAALFVNLLLNAADQREVPIYILLTMRTDSLGDCAQFRGLPEALNGRYYLVPRMTRLQQQEAIQRPLEEQQVNMTPSLVQRVLNDAADDPDHLPVLQHLLKRLWENWDKRREEEPIGAADYEAVGGWERALDTDAEDVLQRFPAEEDNIRRLFQWITDRGTGEKPIRRPRPFAECSEIAGLSTERLSDMVRAFQERGLLKPSDRSNESVIDLPHESVMWQWSRLKRWIAEEAEKAAQLRFLLQSARQNVPVTGLALESALKIRAAWQEQRHLVLRYLQDSEAKEIHAWIAHSEQLDKAKRWRRRWGIPAITGVGIVLAAAAFWSWIAERHRTAAEARELSAWCAMSLSDDPERSLILGLYAWGKQRAMVPVLEQFLHDAVIQSHVRLTVHHQRAVWSVAWSPDGRRLATASWDHTAKIWEARTGRELLTLRGHRDFVRSVAWSPDGSKLATASQDHTAKVWEAGTGRDLLTLRGHRDSVLSVAWSPDGSKLATASWDHTAKVWEAGTGHELRTLSGHRDYVNSVAWSPDGSKLATASRDKTAKLWEAGTGRDLHTLYGHQDSVNSVAWSPDGSKLATASWGWDGTAKVWDSGTGRELLTLRGHQDSVLSVAWSPDGSKLATASWDSTAKVWVAGTGRELLTLRGNHDAVTSVAWSPDGTKLATASRDHTAKLWEPGAGRELLTVRGHDDSVSSVAWSPDGRKLATASADRSAKVWEARTGRELLPLRGHQDSVLSVAWSPDGSKLATASRDHTAKVWEASTGRDLLTLRGHQDSVLSVAWSRDGSKLATASADNTANVWDAGTGRELLILRGHRKPISTVAWSPDGSKLVTASWDHTAKVWDARTGLDLLTLRGHTDYVNGVAWSPDGSKVATASSDTTAKLWQVGTGRELLTLAGHQGSVMDVGWSPDTSEVATASWDHKTKVWDARIGRELLTLRGNQASVNSVAWSPDGKRLASAGNDSIVQVYVMDRKQLLRLVRSRITRDLTTDECRRFLTTEACPSLPRVP